jgi:hypothetical protein
VVDTSALVDELCESASGAYKGLKLEICTYKRAPFALSTRCSCLAMVGPPWRASCPQFCVGPLSARQAVEAAAMHTDERIDLVP